LQVGGEADCLAPCPAVTRGKTILGGDLRDAAALGTIHGACGSASVCAKVAPLSGKIVTGRAARAQKAPALFEP